MLAHRGDDLALAIDAFGSIRKELHVAGGLHDDIDADRKLGKEAVGQIIDDDTDNLRLGIGLAQIGSTTIVDIAEIANDSVDLGAGRLVDQWACLQHERHGRLRHAGGMRNIDHCHPFFTHIFLPARSSCLSVICKIIGTFQFCQADFAKHGQPNSYPQTTRPD